MPTFSRLLPFFFLVSTHAMAAKESDLAAVEIEKLIAAVAASSCQFERNGKRYDSAAAASHLSLKYHGGKSYADTAEHFIDRLAAKSSITHKPYRILCAGEGDYLASQLLRKTLQTIRSSEP